MTRLADPVVCLPLRNPRTEEVPIGTPAAPEDLDGPRRPAALKLQTGLFAKVGIAKNGPPGSARSARLRSAIELKLNLTDQKMDLQSSASR